MGEAQHPHNLCAVAQRHCQHCVQFHVVSDRQPPAPNAVIRDEDGLVLAPYVAGQAFAKAGAQAHHLLKGPNADLHHHLVIVAIQQVDVAVFCAQQVARPGDDALKQVVHVKAFHQRQGALVQRGQVLVLAARFSVTSRIIPRKPVGSPFSSTMSAADASS